MIKTRNILHISAHLLFWIIPILLFESVEADRHLGVFSTGQFAFFYPLYYGIVFSAIYFYSCVYWLMPILLKRYNVLAALLGATLAHLLHSLLESFVDIIVVQANPLVPESVNFQDVLYANLILNILVFLLAIGYFFIENLILSERNKLKLREEKIQMELDFLKSQINPHFLFNVLNSLYGSALMNKDEETADGIAQLSALVRYMLFETNEKEVLLANEVEYLKNYIKLQEKRYKPHDDIHISFEINGDIDNRKIAPMLLIPFVENAFKYGISLKQSSFIKIRLQSINNSIIFEVRNSINPQSRTNPNTGLGLANARKRLELIYGNRFELDISESCGIFVVNLSLKD